MILYPAVILSIFAPGLWFPEMGSLGRNKIATSNLTTNTDPHTAQQVEEGAEKNDPTAEFSATTSVAGTAAGHRPESDTRSKASEEEKVR
jgi:hypothetical protein